MMGNDLVTQEEFDQFVALTILPMQKDITASKKKISILSFVVSALIASLTAVVLLAVTGII